jgi:hypothetical protein
MMYRSDTARVGATRGPMADLLAELRKPVDAVVAPPVQTRHQVLPFGQLSWENFERLCLRLASMESDVRSARPYGRPGQSQEGIDFIAYPKEADCTLTWVYQCKRWQRVTASDFAGWVTALLDSWAEAPPARFTVCTSLALTGPDVVKEMEVQRRRLAERELDLQVWDGEHLNQRLKREPRLVDDFFGRAWAEVFSGTDDIAALSSHLPGEDMVRLRQRLLALYEHLFQQHDPGIAPPLKRSFPLRSRYVWPDILAGRAVPVSSELGSGSVEDVDVPPHRADSHKERPHSARPPGPETIRVPASQWLARQHRAVVLGDLGMGKSCLLRNIALDLLSAGASAHDLAAVWGECTPIWIPFAGWLEAIAKSPIGLMDYMKSWLHQHGADEIAALVDRLAEDGRMLLLLDGLDERTSDHTAHIALDLLEAFLAVHSVPIIATSRLVGYEAITRSEPVWAHGRLAPLSGEQQDALLRSWFRWLGGGDDPQALVVADQEAASLLAEVDTRPELSGLSGVPLTLQMLVELRRRGVSIPQRRFQVYGKLVDCLLEEQPMHRRRAAGRDASGELDLRDRRELLAHLALELQTLGGAGTLPERQCVGSVAAVLADPDSAWGYDRARARQLARGLLAEAVSEAGILVRPLPDRIAFWHLGLQHWLAAYGLSLRRAEEQHRHIMQFHLEPRWREVVLALLELRCNTEGGRDFAVSALEELKGKAESVFAQCQVDALLADAVFADLGLPASYVRAEAQRLLDLVRQSPFSGHAAGIALTALPALRTGPVREIVERNVSGWFPAWNEFSRASLIEHIGQWRPAPDVRQALEWGLYDEDPRCRATAGKAIARSAGGDEAMGQALLQMASHSLAAGPREAALLALAFGWPQMPGLPEVLARSTRDGDPGVRLSAVEGRIALSLQSAGDREILWSLMAEGVRLAYGRRDEVGPALTLGWPHDSELLEECFRALNGHQGRLYGEHAEQAVFALLSGWPGDARVAAYFADWLSADNEDPFRMLRLPGYVTVWDLLARNFRAHPALAPTILEYLKRYPKWYFSDQGRSILACGLEEAKQIALAWLLADERTGGEAGVATNLLTGWPHDDTVVAGVKEWMERNPSRAEGLARFFQIIYPDTQQRRALLLARLSADRSWSVGAILRALLEEDVAWDPDELMEPALRDFGDSWLAQDIHGSIIRAFPSHPRSKEAARALLQQPTAHFPVILAEVYADDKEFRSVVLRAATSAPTTLRRMVADDLSKRSAAPEPALRILRDMCCEDDSLARASAAVGLALHTAANGTNAESLVRFLHQEAICVGPELDQRRPSGLAGLLQAGEVESVVRYATEGDPVNPLESAFRMLDPNTPTLRLLASRWPQVKAALPFGASATLGIDPDIFWDRMSPWVEEFGELQVDFEAYVRAACDRPLPVGTLTAIASVAPGSEVLRQACIAALSADARGLRSSWGTAARVVGTHFGGQEAVLRDLLAVDVPGRDWPITLALSWGWPEASEFRRRVEQTDGEPMPWLLYLQLARVLGAWSDFVDSAAEYVEKCSGGGLYRDPEIVRVIVLCGREEGSVREGITRWLSGGQDLATSAAGLLRASGAIAPELRADLVLILQREAAETVPPVVGYDLVLGQRRTLAEAVYSALSGIT